MKTNLKTFPSEITFSNEDEFIDEVLIWKQVFEAELREMLKVKLTIGTKTTVRIKEILGDETP